MAQERQTDNAPAAGRTVFVCSCEGTMPIDGTAIDRHCGGAVTRAEQLCRRELARFEAALGTAGPITVACTQEAPLFGEIAEGIGREDVTFVNIRETAGWAADAAKAAPKMAALIAAAAEPMPDSTLVTLESQGVALILGRDAVALEVADALAETLDITVVIGRTEDLVPRRVTTYPILRGRARSARGHLGDFEVTVDDCAQPLPSSRGAYRFGPAKDGAVSRCDMVIDLTGGPALVPAADLRPGYLKADPAHPAAVTKLICEAAELVGTFDKPRYIDFSAELCAHQRSGKTGCTRCLSLCPTGAITPSGNHVAIDPAVCAGCGSCAAACPTGAAAYALPPADAITRRVRTLLQTYAAAGGVTPVLLVHDGEHGEALIDALARFGDGLPAHVLPLRVNEVTQLGLETIAAAFAYGAAGVQLLSRAKPRHDQAGLVATLDLANRLLAGLGYGTGVVGLVETDDPDALRTALLGAPLARVTANPASFVPRDRKRRLLQLSLRSLHEAAPAPVDIIPLPAGAPVGGVVLDQEKCTLCLACVSACPVGALSDNPERPMLRFSESLCVQCGLCAATCPEDAIGLVARVDFPAWQADKRVLKEEEPFHCIGCAKPFGTKSTIERIRSKLEGKHWMFAGANASRLDLLMMCEDCRVERVVNEGLDPHAAPPRPRTRTSEDYIRERDAGHDDLP